MFELPKLPYAYNALEPYIDEQTMTVHHTKHHQAYVDNANKALEKHPELLKQPIHALLMDLNKIPEDVRAAFRNHGGGHANHSMFWMSMKPKGGGEPHGELKKAIDKSFGNFATFKEKFSNAAMTRFGSGWAFLALNKGALEVYNLPNQDSPLSEGKVPLLGLDVWEHAYYIKYQNRRKEYVDNWWNTINWEMIEDWYKKSNY